MHERISLRGGEEQLLPNPILEITEPYSSMILAISRFPFDLTKVKPQERRMFVLIPWGPTEYSVQWKYQESRAPQPITGYLFKLRYAKDKNGISLTDFTTTLNPPPDIINTDHDIHPELTLMFESNRLDSITLTWQASPETHQTIFDLLGDKNDNVLASFLDIFDKAYKGSAPRYDDTINFLFNITLARFDETRQSGGPQLYFQKSLRGSLGPYDTAEYKFSPVKDGSEPTLQKITGYPSLPGSINTDDFLQILTSTLKLIPTTPLRPVANTD